MKHALLFAPLLACSAPLAGQVVLVIDTDALLPPANGQQATHPALFDALAVDVFMPGENEPCAGCSQQFAIDEGIVNAGKASVGIPELPHVPGYRARVRLYHTRSAGAGPSPDTSIEAVVALPATDDTGEIVVSVMLPTDSLAAPIGTLDDPIEPAAGGVTSGHAGTWPGGASIPCATEAKAGEVCVPGGAFWMGNPSASFAGGAGASTNLERLVVLSPFFIDAYETTVGEYRGHPTTTVALWSGSTSGSSPMDWCSYSPSASRNALVLNCIDWSAARDYCGTLGRSLPSEAQLEYLEGGLSSSLYVWGAEDPQCGDAVFGRTGFGVSWGSGDGECRLPSAFGGPLEPRRDHTGSRDVLLIGDQSIYDLAGNIAEWALDSYEPEGGDCWSVGVIHDPVCKGSSSRLLRGGSWVTPPVNLRAAARVPRENGPGAPDVGVRCAREDG